MQLPRLLTAAAVAAALVATAAQAAPAGQFLRKAMMGDTSEVMLGRLAALRGGPGVRAYGQALARDHGAHRTQVATLARRMGVRVRAVATPEANAEYRKLNRLRGPAFNREFARYMEGDHRKDIRDYQDQAQTGDPRTAALARDTLPTLRKHLDMALRLGG